MKIFQFLDATVFQVSLNNGNICKLFSHPAWISHLEAHWLGEGLVHSSNPSGEKKDLQYRF